jgi:hypothetical protein
MNKVTGEECSRELRVRVMNKVKERAYAYLFLFLRQETAIGDRFRIDLDDIQYHVPILLDYYRLMVCNFLFENLDQVSPIYKQGGVAKTSWLPPSTRPFFAV